MDFCINTTTRSLATHHQRCGHAGPGGGQGNYGEGCGEDVFRGTSKVDNLCGVV